MATEYIFHFPLNALGSGLTVEHIYTVTSVQFVVWKAKPIKYLSFHNNNIINVDLPCGEQLMYSKLSS